MNVDRYREVRKDFGRKFQFGSSSESVLPEYKLIIESDGPQHFRQISNWSSPVERFQNDRYKENCANDNGYSIIRLSQEDVLNDTYDWENELCNAIGQIKTQDGITNMYLSKNNEYDNFKMQL